MFNQNFELAKAGCRGGQVGMDGLGERLRARARELGWSDAEVARRVGLAQTRYANYVTDRHEPDLATFVRICSVLGASAADLLNSPSAAPDRTAALRSKISAAAEALDTESLGVAAIVLDGLLARSAPSRPATAQPHGGPGVPAG